MNPLILLAAAAAGALYLFSGKKQTPTTSGTTIKVPAQPTTTIKVPGGTITVPSTQSGTTITLPEVATTGEAPAPPGASTASDVELPPAPTAQEQAKDGSALSYEEWQSVESSLPDDLYRMAMASQHKAYVVAAAARLASLGDTRAAHLTQRLANWGN